MKKLHIVHMIGPRSFPDGVDAGSAAALVELARRLEAAGFSALVFPNVDGPAAMRDGLPFLPWEPFTACGALAVATTSIGLVASVAAATSEPYNVARRLASLDHISRGRIGWNLAASVEGLAGQYDDLRGTGRPVSPDVAGEFTKVVKALWDSWGDDAIIVRDNGRSAVDGSKNHPIHHQGDHYRVKGPLDVPRPPQGNPPLFQCVDTEEDLAIAALHADVVMPELRTRPALAEFRRHFAGMLRANGRTSGGTKIMPRLPVDGSDSIGALVEQIALLAEDGVEGICLAGPNALRVADRLIAELPAAGLQVDGPGDLFLPG